MSGQRAWLEFSREDFDADADAPALFDAAPEHAASPLDGCGTGDLFELLADEPADQS